MNAHVPFVSLSLVTTVALIAQGLPPWSWDTVQTYIHCANVSGEWNDGALRRLAQQPFVVFEKPHKLFYSGPDGGANTSAETKIAESCRLVKQLSPSTDCYIYVESDWARTFYSLGHWVAANRDDVALQCPGDGEFVNTTSHYDDDEGNSDAYFFYAYDFNSSEMRDKWVSRVTDVVARGHVDGAFIDGNRGGFGSGILGPCDKTKQQGWASGLKEAHVRLAEALGPDRTLISNYPTDDALAICSGGMMERGGSIPDIMSWADKRCGRGQGPCLLDYHAQYADRSLETFNTSLANFLIGMYKFAYFGVGGGWWGAGPTACSTWLRDYPEYSKPLGEPNGRANVSQAPASFGLNCSLVGPKPSDKDTAGCVFTRTFATGTKVFVGPYLRPELDSRGRVSNSGSCVYWSDGTTTSPNVTRCPPRGDPLWDRPRRDIL